MKALCIAKEPMLSVLVVRGVVEAAEQSGVSRDQLLHAAGIEDGLIDSDTAYVPRSEVYRLCELAVDLTRDPALGLHWAEHLNPNTFNPISHLIDHSVTLRQGFESLFRFHRLVSDQPSFDLSESGDKVTLRYFGLHGESARMQRFAAEVMVTGIFRMVRSFAPHARPERVCFEHSAPEYHAEYARVFENTECFDQRFTGIVFDRALMDAVSPHKDTEVHEALRAIAERRILRLTERAPFALRVRERLVQLGPARADMNAVARSLGLCARSLRRRLVAEGKSYNELVNEALAIVAKRLLRDDRLTIQEAAYEMGFADSSTFHRAFKRWTGMTPNSFRGEQLGN